ncbi:hypothetical protein PM082_016861 [Marasmius tenuissimus]|nr:hypothetical protein PM082_016861 [Marasmius tenuissimus]
MPMVGGLIPTDPPCIRPLNPTLMARLSPSQNVAMSLILTLTEIKFSRTPTDLSVVHSRPSSKCLDIRNGDATNGNKLQIWSCVEGSANQQWKFNSSTIGWVGKNKCVDIASGGVAAGNTLQISDSQYDFDGDTQSWHANLANRALPVPQPRVNRMRSRKVEEKLYGLVASVSTDCAVRILDSDVGLELLLIVVMITTEGAGALVLLSLLSHPPFSRNFRPNFFSPFEFNDCIHTSLDFSG